MKLKTFLNNTKPINESRNLFAEVDTIKIDPDRDAVNDVVDNLLPTIVKLAYVNLYREKEAHEKKFGEPSTDEDAYNFSSFNTSGLIDEIDTVKDLMKEKLSNISDSEFKDIIKQLKFIHKLED
jgi:hypothetical protein